MEGKKKRQNQNPFDIGNEFSIQYSDPVGLCTWFHLFMKLTVCYSYRYWQTTNLEPSTQNKLVFDDTQGPCSVWKVLPPPPKKKSLHLSSFISTAKTLSWSSSHWNILYPIVFILPTLYPQECLSHFWHKSFVEMKHFDTI